MMRATVVLLSTLSLTLSACGSPGAQSGPAAPGEVDRAATYHNGIYLNGIYLNGIYLNGIYLNGIYLNGIYLNGIYLNGIYLNGTQLVGVTPDGHRLSGKDFVGATLAGTLADGSTAQLVITAMNPKPIEILPDQDLVPNAAHQSSRNGHGIVRESHDNGDIYLYTVVFRTPAGDVPICGSDAQGVPDQAFPLSGRWNPSTGDKINDPSLFTFACNGGALAKCAEFGYKPWLSARKCGRNGCSTVSLADYHQACTRMVRADYCGDGTSYTIEGEPIDVMDNLGIQVWEARNWSYEAEWTPSGATCVRSPRHAAAVPTCSDGRVLTDCSNAWMFQNGTLLATQHQP